MAHNLDPPSQSAATVASKLLQNIEQCTEEAENLLATASAVSAALGTDDDDSSTSNLPNDEAGPTPQGKSFRTHMETKFEKLLAKYSTLAIEDTMSLHRTIMKSKEEPLIGFIALSETLKKLDQVLGDLGKELGIIRTRKKTMERKRSDDQL